MSLPRIFKPKEEKKDKPAKQPRQVDAAAAAGPLDHTSLAQYKRLNPQLPSQLPSQLPEDVIVLDGPPEDAVAELGDDGAAEEQTEEELEKSPHSAREREAAETLTLPAWWTPTFQLHLDIQMQYDLTVPSWEGEYVTPQADAPIPAFGQADQAVGAHVDRNALYLRLQAKPT
ncbi:TPA: hypothetical protein ACH3X1_014168 [Trebouxia sp. C0004]